MKHYAVAELEITDPSWVPSYVQATTRLVEEHGGRYLARTERVAKMEGERPAPQIALLIEWPTREAAKAFYGSAAYAPHLAARRAGSRGELLLVAGEDASGAARM